MELFHKPKGVPGYLNSHWLLIKTFHFISTIITTYHILTVIITCYSNEKEKLRKCMKQTYYMNSLGAVGKTQPPKDENLTDREELSKTLRCRNTRVYQKNFHTSISWTQCCFVISVVLSVVCASGIGLVGAQKIGEDTNEPGICKSVDIRNSVQTFERLRGCRVVEGFVQILLFDSAEESLYDNLTFPELTEITGYLLLYRVNGLRTLGNLFPNLAVIRGQTLFFQYAFVIFEMSSLREIGLYSLTDIVHGLVRIDKNPSLCYVNTIDWDMIAHEGKGEHFIKSNKLENECPICPGDDGDDKGIKCPLVKNKPDSLALGPKPGRHLCWNQTMCQKVCECTDSRSCNEKKECCNHLCLGGCSGPRGTDCTVCRYLSFGSGNSRQCLQKCPSDTYEFMNRRCIYEHECFEQRRPPEIEKIDSIDDDERPYKAFNHSCLLECPPGYYETRSPDGRKTCGPCQNGMCKKECPGINVDSISSAKELRGCTHIKGSLEIQIRGSRNVVKELEENLNMIEEIDGYLKIVRSFPLISLNFLKKLRIIHGNTLENQKYAFVVLDNQNLQELWDWENDTKKIEIKNGRLFFHFNPKLCREKIKKLQIIANLSEFNDMEVATTSNGDKVACQVTELKVNVSTVYPTAAVLHWKKFQMEDHRSLLGYVVYSIEAPSKNISLYDGRDACGGDGWKVDDVTHDDDNSDDVYHPLSHLKPYTQYAFYVRTYTIATETRGAQSKIQYLRTQPDTPSIPMNVRAFAANESVLTVNWLPPISPNGNITHYEVTATWEHDDQKFLQQRNYCKEPLIQTPEEKKETPITHIEVTTIKDSNESCACEAPTEKIPKGVKENEVMSQINFENELHNRVYIKRVEPRRKREIESTKKRYSAATNMQEKLLSNSHSQEQTTITTTTTTNKNNNNSNATGLNSPPHYFKNIVNTTSITLEHLHHYAKYTISVRACREMEPHEKKDTEKETCSTQSIVTQRTKQKSGVDMVQNVKVEILNSNQSLGMVKLTWDEPSDPNGIILTYNIAYIRNDKARYFKKLYECITQQMFIQMKKQYILKDLHPGNYTVTVQVTTLAGDGNTTKEISFFIPETGSFYTTTIITVVVLVVIVLIGGISLHILYRKFFSSNIPNVKLIASVNPEYVSTVYVPDDWEVPRGKIEFIQELGQGSFGMVYEGIARDVVKGKPEMRCAIKTVNEHATDRERIEFLNEASVMKAFNTTHVVQLLGVVSKGQPTLVVMELMANGDLKSYLRSHRPDADSYNTSPGRYPPTLKRILQMAIEIADGMAYLAAKKFVHRDLAARNCMVAEDLTVKIGDFGMTRDIYETDYYRKGTKGLLPVRWMAPESLKDGVFTSSSDVWSYGVVLWEMATLASQPYQGLSNDQVLRYVIDGGIMERPENCPDKLYTLMRNCWQHKPSLRPSFLELEKDLLEDANSNFKNVSFYHSPAGVEARTLHSTAQDDPSTPLRSTKDIEDFSLGSGSESEAESIGDHHVHSDIDGLHVTIDFPRFQAASFKDNQKSMDTSGPSLFSYKDDISINANSGPSLCSFNEQPPITNSSVRSGVDFLTVGEVDELMKKPSTRLLNNIDNDFSADSNTANGYLAGNRPVNGTTNKTTQC